MLSHNKNEEWKEEEQVKEGVVYQERYEKKWWEKWIFENQKLHYFLALIGFFVIIFLVGYYSGLWFHVGSLLLFGFVLTIVEILRIRRHMYYIVETRIAGDKITRPDGSVFIVQDTETRLVEIPDFAYSDFSHFGTNGAPLPVQSSRVVFADYVDTENKLIYHSPDLEFANAVLEAKANIDIIEARDEELDEIDIKQIDEAIEKLSKIKSTMDQYIAEKRPHHDLWVQLSKFIQGKIEELESIREGYSEQDKLLISKEFKRTYRITPSVKRNLFLHYKNTIPDLRSALFLLQNNLREFADAVATAKLYSSLGRTMPLDVRRRIAEVFEKLGYGDIFNLEKKEEVKEHVVHE